MRIRLDPSQPFNLDATLCCGQVFRWDKQDQWWYGVVRDKVFKVLQASDELKFENIDVDFLERYFRLDDDLLGIYDQIGKDDYVRQALGIFKGLRIVRQDPWECLISYICATYKSIAAIRHMLLNLSRCLGKRLRFEGRDFHAFPTAEQVAAASIDKLEECGLGYRAKYVAETARIICENGLDLESLRKVPYETARNELLSFPGVGLKVADCILLFSLEKTEAFPVDVWMKRVILRHYSKHLPASLVKKISLNRSLRDFEYKKLSLFGRSYFGEYSGYAQEYLYHYERSRH